MGIGTAANTHRMYDTVGHEHLDGLVNWAIGEFPDTGLLLIECRDGRWFVEVEYGDDYDAIAGVSKPNVAPYVEPQFFSSEDDARQFAFTCIKQVYPTLAGRDLAEYYDDEE